MCGITGVISLSGSKINTDRIKSMCDVIEHRGPDGAGYFLAQTGVHHPREQQYHQALTEKKYSSTMSMLPSIDDPQARNYLNAHHWDLYFGHRRLAILDLSPSGFQPISDISQNVWVTYNGEIYNFKEIRKELEGIGYEFFSTTDSEVLVNAYIEWGIECVTRFNGMFAFALWDKRRNKVFLARDRYGIKPLYYHKTRKNELVFASETKSILAYLEDKPKVNPNGIIEYFVFQNLISEQTLTQDVYLLPPGHYMEVYLGNDPKNIIKQHWDFNFTESTEIRSEEDYSGELAYLFEQAVKRQLVSDVEIGSYLSGGMDSGSITAVAANHLPYMKTFTVGFDLNNVSGLELSFDERAKSELLSYLYHTEHYEMVLKSGDMERCLNEFAWHMEEPRVGQSYPNFYAAKLASKFVKVVLSGTGGDELFAGYPWRYQLGDRHGNESKRVNEYFHFWQRLIKISDLNSAFGPLAAHVNTDLIKNTFYNVYNKHIDSGKNNFINNALYFEAKTFLHGLLLVEDKLSMAHSLETRVPFLDNDLVDFAQKIPVHLKVKKTSAEMQVDENRVGTKHQVSIKPGGDGKLILRKALSKYMPSEYLNAAKQGFSSPDNSWFKGQSIDLVKHRLLPRNAALYNYLDHDFVSSKIERHFSGIENQRLLIWSLLNFSYWIEIFGN
ncbi:asparagine synthase (glutamine-hydrolyzing) [Legionella shakespearei]|uniref:asparagine synthase (glutamine-hydrolyzing) n=1 Tax=Legionella shakespearei DSM 23087 TaxID=1122169 RepID=A0A0W0YV45_9GAMM|nr:asparagine synthase (glutamine-hydrolyzing) [Legionella shakespearei]KTD60728.1 asparagine synthetase, glutamine-hydrolyzing [Legionella shakespearei DSM 23087]